ncbi:GMC oxidoreductase [Podospora australis]|uniref:GMC oxidoreductase n=1 Tax=Podospora australis TaxID=1536484 RepID=A0AAN7ADS2_9PEZI|nr:GMC oxidoreductase [Podospora australis]
MRLQRIVLACLYAALAFCNVKKGPAELRDKYDFIIAGGGTSGLTVADRLSEALPGKTILVVEYGEVEYAAGIYDPPRVFWNESGGLASRITHSGLPSPALNNQTATVLVGQVVGGSSAVNGMFFDRPSRFDFDAWTRAQESPEFDNSPEKWDWNGIYPFFKKSVRFTAPSAVVAAQFGYTWNASHFDNTSRIHASLPPFLWGDINVSQTSWKEMGVRPGQDPASGDKDGIFWVPISQHPITGRRSHSGLGHYLDVAASRPNYDLLVRHQVNRVIYPGGNPASDNVPVVEVLSRDTGRVFNITATAEVIISAGAIYTPGILQRSGIGPANFLTSRKIPVVIDLPGVGSNFQDHSGPRPAVNWRYTKPTDFSPMPDDMGNPAFLADAIAGFNETPARGPYTLAMSNLALFLSLPNMTANYSPILDKVRSLISSGKTISDLYLPPVYGQDGSLIKGYIAQLEALLEFYSNPRAPSLESAFATGFNFPAVLLHPLSRGTVRISSDPLTPILDYRSASNPIDIDLHIVHVKYLRRALQTPTLQNLGAVEVLPGENVQTDEELEAYVRGNTTQSYMHPCCTASMLPKEKGGVVGPELKVHGAKGLRVVDISVLPLLPSAHTSALAYAIGEKVCSPCEKR